MNLPVDLPISALAASVRMSSRSVFRSLNCNGSSEQNSYPDNPSLGALFSGIDFLEHKGNGEKRVTCLITDSRRVVPGALFFAIGGLRTDGNHYIEEAVDRGAVGIVTDQDLGTRFPVDYIVVSDVRVTLSVVAKKFYGYSDKKLEIAGITGTNGKTTVSMLLQYLLGNNEKTGLIGTIRYDVGKRTLPAFRTTPESVDIHALMKQMVDSNCSNAVMEVSSHGIDQKRIHGLAIDVAVFLNLSQDHLDYHKTMEAYFESKKSLFTGAVAERPKQAVINSDCIYGQRLIDTLDKCLPITTFGLGAGAQISATEILLLPDRTECTVHWPEGSARVTSPLTGAYNVSNLLAALAAGYAMGRSIQDMLERLSSFRGVPGRMERIDGGQPFNLFVDYAHTDDAIANVSSVLREITGGRLILVFGCGGNRDRSKRAPMLAAALKYADQIYVTADNPRNEPIEQIFDDMRKGMEAVHNVTFINDRKRAISAALDIADANDCVLVAGKGHETFQEFDGTVIPFDDRAVARDLLALKSYQQGGC